MTSLHLYRALHPSKRERRSAQSAGVAGLCFAAAGLIVAVMAVIQVVTS